MTRRRTPTHPLTAALVLSLAALGLWLAHGAPGAARLEPRLQRQAGELALHAGRGVRAAAAAVTSHYVDHGRATARR